MAVITLLTDFGYRDEYVGVVKGMIIGIHPAATIIDITHGIAPQDVVSAAYTLKAACGYFPKGTIHVAVVDPGVGSQRDIVAVQSAGHLFLAPDNGLLGPIIEDGWFESGYRVENENLFRQPVSRTFHGRDKFAPVAAHLSAGLPLKAVGRPLERGQLRTLDIREPRMDDSGILEGEVVRVDRFGNLITNIHARHLTELQTDQLRTTVCGRVMIDLADGYFQGSPDAPLAIIGSHDYLEIAVNGGSAAEVLQATPGDLVRVKAGHK